MKKSASQENEELRQRSRYVDHPSKLVSFLYDLVRDHVPPGKLEQLVRDAQDVPVEYTNGFLANFAIDVAHRLDDSVRIPHESDSWKEDDRTRKEDLMRLSKDFMRDPSEENRDYLDMWLTSEWLRIEREARLFAIRAHKDQKYGDQPYDVHLAAVNQVVHDFDLQGPISVAAYLHDVIEDTDVCRPELEERFGKEVTDLVWAVTGQGKSRAECNESIHAKIRALPEAMNLKLADRIANVEASKNNPKMFYRYVEEHVQFSGLRAMGNNAMWERLERALERKGMKDA